MILRDGVVAMVAVAVTALTAAPLLAGEIVSRAEAQQCREEISSEENYSLTAKESERRGEGFRAESSVTICRVCNYPIAITAGTSFTAIDVDLLLRSIKGKVKFSGSMLPFISRIQERCGKPREESAEGGVDP